MSVQSNTPDHPLLSPVEKALGSVIDPEIRRPITELGMLKSVDIAEDSSVRVELLLTVAGCPMKDTLTKDVTKAVAGVAGTGPVSVDLGVMSDEQRAELKTLLRGPSNDREIPFARPDSLTKVIAVASGKGGVGKSSVTVNLAHALAAAGRSVGVLDADIYGHSIPTMLGVSDARPTSVDDMILPVPAMGMKVISIGMLKPRKDQVVAWRGPILDRALQQMLADVYWGDLDYLLLDLPPGTGDVQISIGQKLPNAEVLVVTTPQQAAAEVAERAGTMASMMNQRVVGVVENMAYLEVTCPHCGSTHRHDVFGSGGGRQVAQTLSTRLGYPIELLAQVPLDTALRHGGDIGSPVVADPTEPAAVALADLAAQLDSRGRNLAGRQLGLSPVGR
ncbi:Mrp/NBP35 family ATP-binding protein [Naumannella halotolerans]|uniref:Mrp/NBP35 family ATP-binding protein n=1 Tax=Naumannella halotolerans TaxID=993414 RepID=UPI00370DDC23